MKNHMAMRGRKHFLEENTKQKKGKICTRYENMFIILITTKKDYAAQKQDVGN